MLSIVGTDCVYYFSFHIYISIDYVSAIYETLISTPREDLKCVKDELNGQIPEALHTMLANKETSEDAKKKYKSRKGRETLIWPPTAELEELVQAPTSKRKTPACKRCGRPRKGHEKGQCSS